MIPIPALLDVGAKILDKVLPNEAAKSEAMAKLKEIEQNGKISELNINLEEYKTEQNNLTERLKADMASDSWLSKNVRPATLVYILNAYLIFALLDGAGYKISESYVSLLGQWGMLIMSFYFGGRTLEKIIDMKSKK